nr:hypothetical protein [Tanacetum cinerariifolium]
MSSNSAHSTVSYTSISSEAQSWSIPNMDPYKELHILVYVPEPDYPKYLALSDDDILVEDQPLPVDASPAALSPGYVADSDLEEDPINYVVNADEMRSLSRMTMMRRRSTWLLLTLLLL